MIIRWPCTVSWRSSGSDRIKIRTSQSSISSISHARKVLAAFGRGYGNLPDDPKEMTGAQNEFLDRAIKGLSQEGRVVSVRLALFAEMLKGKPWTPETLKQVGGTEGVGVAFLEETFRPDSPAVVSHPPEGRSSRLQGTAARDRHQHQREHAVAQGTHGSLRLRLPPEEFDELLRILNSELSLITPIEPEGSESDGRQDATGREVLSAHPRLPRALAPGMADPQAAGNPPRPGRTAAGGALLALERPAREPAPAFAGNGRTSVSSRASRTGPSRSGR